MARTAKSPEELAAAARALKQVSEIAPELERADTQRGASDADWRHLFEVAITVLCPACRVAFANAMGLAAGEPTIGAQGKGSAQTFDGKSVGAGGSANGGCSSAHVAGEPEKPV